ncbi:MAG: hypothetical protein PHH13_05405 [Candidatus Peribacteraceae bacterium]|nr:hypothetical protein [Candidatus Peribacteraceae bacterium]
MATVLEEPLEKTSPAERQEGDVLTRLEELRSTLSSERMQELFDEACRCLTTAFAHADNRHSPPSDETVNEALIIFAERIAERYRKTDDFHGERYEEQEFFRHAYRMAADTIAKLLKPSTHDENVEGAYTAERCSRALGLLGQRLRDSFLESVAFESHDEAIDRRIRTSQRNLQKLVAECFELDAQILYLLDCARMHVDHILSHQCESQQLAHEQWGAWENLYQADMFIAQCEHAQQEDARALRYRYHEAVKYVRTYLGGGPRARAA